MYFIASYHDDCLACWIERLVQQFQEMGLLPHSARTTSCPLLYGCMPGLRDTHSCAVFVCSFVITSSSQSSAISSKPVYLSPSRFLPLWQSFFLLMTWLDPSRDPLWCLWQSSGECWGRASVMSAEHLSSPFNFFPCLRHLKAVISAFCSLRLHSHILAFSVFTDSHRKVPRFRKTLV